VIKAGIVDYRCGNIRSLFNALEFIQANPFLIKSYQDFDQATHIILPGVGAFGYCIENLRKSTLLEPLSEHVFEKFKPLLGICVGMQMLLEQSKELGNHNGLGWINGSVEELKKNKDDAKIKVPHVGWNSVTFANDSKFFRKEQGYDFYFDHSYAAQNVPVDNIAGETSHGSRFPSVIRKNNILASQFHPEKSQANGLNFLKDFLES
jgi:imidazole glycerol-phosphate synthase subunit HisH